MLSRLATLLAFTCLSAGCSTQRTDTVIIGGDHIMFYGAGLDVPAVPASVNTNGWYSLSAEELNGLLNP